MPKSLQIHLQDGFDQETVTISVDGREIYNRQGVRTRYQIGLADSLSFDSDHNVVHIRVVLPARSSSADLELDIGKTPYLGVSIDDEGKIILRPTSEPFMYA